MSVYVTTCYGCGAVDYHGIEPEPFGECVVCGRSSWKLDCLPGTEGVLVPYDEHLLSVLCSGCGARLEI